MGGVELPWENALVAPLPSSDTVVPSLPSAADAAGGGAPTAAQQSREVASGSRAVVDGSDDEAEGLAGTGSKACDEVGTPLSEEGVFSGRAKALRSKLEVVALSDEEALRLLLDGNKAAKGGSSGSAPTAQRARFSKLAENLKKVISVTGSDEASSQAPGGQAINFELAEAALVDFCKVLGQSQREADLELVLKLGCTGVVVDICLRVKDALGALPERTATAVLRQMNNVMLSALKFLGLLCRHDSHRNFMLLTGRAVLLGDVASACLDTNFGGAALPLLDAQSASVLFLPQVLHLLSSHVRQPLLVASENMPQDLVLHLLLSGLPEKLRQLLRQAEVRGMKLFDGASPVPLLLLRAMGFLGSLVKACIQESGTVPLADDSEAMALVTQMLRRTELFGIVDILSSILLSEGKREKPPSGTVAKNLPQTVLSLALQAVCILNDVARLNLAALQEALGACRQELYHLLVCLVDYCSARLSTAKLGQDKAQEEVELLHEVIIFLGFYCLLKEEHQSIMSYGEGQTLLAKVTSLPLHYFMDERGRAVLFPTIVATSFRSSHNLELLRSEMNLSLLRTFLTKNLAKEEAIAAGVETAATSAAAAGGFSGRFPQHLWQEALLFFSEEEEAAEAEAEG